MTQENNLKSTRVYTGSLTKRMLIGAAIALTFIGIFLYKAGEPDPEWPKYWMVKPLLIVPFAGAVGGFCYHLMDHLRYLGGWRKVVANIISVIIYIIGLWMGIVLGLDGTMWN